MLHRLVVSACASLVVAAVFGLSFVEPTTGRRVAPPDTLRRSASAGEPLIVALPPRLGENDVDRYVLLEGPALSGVADRSFTWITRPDDSGTHDVLFRPQPNPLPGDTLVLRVEIE